MKPGDYWANHCIEGWIMVEVVAGLYHAVLRRGCSMELELFDSKFIGPLQPPPSPDCTPAWIQRQVAEPKETLEVQP